MKGEILMKTIEEMTTQEVVERFRGISRQRISQILAKYAKRGDVATMQKINKAKTILKQEKREAKAKILKNENFQQQNLDSRKQ
jgi:hypothetical protein